jgi:signal transduction histidine kinase
VTNPIHTQNIDLSGSKILAIDDVRVNLEALKENLETQGYKISVSLGGNSAIEIAKAFTPDLILLDVIMPEPNGFEICKQLKTEKMTRDIPVLFLTALDEPSDILKGFQAGGLDYIVKPFNDEELFARVKTHLELSALRKRDKKLIFELKEANLKREEAQKNNQNKSDFLSRMSHEFRTPMNAIIGFADLLNYSNDLAEPHRSKVEFIRKASKHLLSFLNNVLGLSESESNRLNFPLNDLNVNSPLEEAINLLIPLAEEKNVQIIKQGFDDEALLVHGNSERLKQAFFNLVSNSIKFNKPGGKVTINYEKQENNFLRISIIDTGIGISSGDFESIFKPFNQYDDGFPQESGLGIGLSVAKSFIEHMGGFIKVESSVGEGSCFSVDLLMANGENS